MKSVKIFLTTKDGARIAANLYPAESPRGWIIFSHMMPAVKESWSDLAASFQSAGYESVAIDLRGHGESVSAKLNYRTFSDADSPGLDYRGIKTESLAKNLKAGQKVFFISSRNDPNAKNSAEENQKLYDLTPAGAEKRIQIYETGGHGTDILENQPELAKSIKDFISG